MSDSLSTSVIGTFLTVEDANMPFDEAIERTLDLTKVTSVAESSVATSIAEHADDIPGIFSVPDSNLYVVCANCDRGSTSKNIPCPNCGYVN